MEPGNDAGGWNLGMRLGVEPGNEAGGWNLGMRPGGWNLFICSWMPSQGNTDSCLG